MQTKEVCVNAGQSIFKCFQLRFPEFMWSMYSDKQIWAGPSEHMQHQSQSLWVQMWCTLSHNAVLKWTNLNKTCLSCCVRHFQNLYTSVDTDFHIFTLAGKTIVLNVSVFYEASRIPHLSSTLHKRALQTSDIHFSWLNGEHMQVCCITLAQQAPRDAE